MTTSKSSEPESSPRKSGATTAAARYRARERPDVGEGFFTVIWPMPPGIPVPSLARRSAAFALDLVVALPLLALSIATTEIVSGGDLLRFDALVRSGVMFLVLLSVQFACWESSPTRATPGKILVDLRVATASGQPLSFADAMIRFWLRIASIATANAGFGMACTDARRRGLHDRLCGTVVVTHYVTPGQLRVSARPTSRSDLVTAVVASALAYACVFETAPSVVRQVNVADRFETAIVELTPVLASGDLVDAAGKWTRSLRVASASIDELQLAMEVNPEQGLVLRARVGGAGREPEVRLERRAAAPGVVAWTCTRSGLAFYATPRHCTELIGGSLEPEAALSAMNPA